MEDVIQIEFDIDDELYSQLIAFADYQGATIEEICSEAIIHYLDAHRHDFEDEE